jgi:hypothetical protein
MSKAKNEYRVGASELVIILMRNAENYNPGECDGGQFNRSLPPQVTVATASARWRLPQTTAGLRVRFSSGSIRRTRLRAIPTAV